ncbi:MAG: sulfatase-like hydrolase/transferase [Bacillota bacterium]|nr:sulfatase-like hydrolase/transferase [Bacillota bacterium]
MTDKDTSRKPNVLFILTDDQRFDTIHALGNAEVATPNLDRLVNRGTAFTRAHIPCGTSGAVCMPSRAMIHTGRTLFHLQQEGQEIPPEHTTLGECFRSADYRTFGTGKWHNGTAAYARSFTDGGSIFFGGMWDHWNVPVCDHDPTGAYDNEINCIMNFQANSAVTRVHCDRYTPGKHSTELISDEAVQFIGGYSTDQPFFMYVSYLAPHDPRSMPERFKALYDPESIALPENFMSEHPFQYGVQHIRDEVLAASPRDPAEIRRHLAEYYAMITHLDFEIGRILQALDESGQMDETIIVLAGDNGLALGQHGLMGKQNCYDHSIRIPLIFCGPGIPVGQRCDQYAYLLDIYPTLCELLSIEQPATVEGLSLLPSMQNPQVSVRDTLYFAYTDLIRSVKDDRYKLIEYAGNIRQTQLFDLLQDPAERQNLYGQEDHAAIVDRLRLELMNFRDQWDDRQHRLGDAFWSQCSL